MALAAGDRVAVFNGRPLNGQTVLSQPPQFGTVVDEAAVDVLWDDGRFQQTIDADALDQLVDASGGGLAYERRVVRLLDSSGEERSSAYDCLVLAAYGRSQAGTGSSVDTYLLCKSLATGAFFETTTGSVKILPGR